MKVGFPVLDFLTEMIYDTDITSSPLITFFNQYGLNKPQTNMLTSKRNFARECLGELNGKSELRECIKDILNPSFVSDEFGSREDVISKLNRVMRYDGFEVIDDGSSIEIVPLMKTPGQGHLDAIGNRAVALDHESLQSEIRRIERSIQDDPSLAIGSAKEMIESVCKSILEQLGETGFSGDVVPELVKKTRKKLKLVPDDIPDHVRGAKAVRLILSNLGTIAQHTAELRNLYGSGHGKAGTRKGLSPRHARLAVGAASTLALFLLETFEEQQEDLSE